MAISGITIPPDVIETYKNGLKLKRTYKYLILEIKGNAVAVKKEGPAKATLDDFIKALGDQNDFCYGVYSGDTKIGVLIYGPQGADFKKGMIYASTAPSVIQSLEGAYDCRKADGPEDIKDLLKNAGIITQ